MKRIALGLIALVAALHFYIAWFEIFAWTSRGPVVFQSFPPELFEQTIQMAANQGIYNAFLGAGLVWSLCITDAKWQARIASCFLIFVFVAGLGAALTVALRPGLVQMVPSALGLLFVFLSRNGART